MESNEQIYQRFLDGDDGCLTLLMERLGDPVTVYAFGYLCNLEDAEDIMIEAFSYLVVKRPRIRDNGLKAYLYKMVRHMALRTKEKRRKEFSVSMDDMVHLADGLAGVEEIVGNQERGQVLRVCMETLPGDYREALYLVYFEGVSHKEAGKIMRKREKQVADLVYRGKKALKLKLEKEGITNA